MRPGRDQSVLLPFLDCARVPNQCDREEEIKFIVNWRVRNKTTTVWRWCIYVHKIPKEYIEKLLDLIYSFSNDTEFRVNCISIHYEPISENEIEKLCH